MIPPARAVSVVDLSAWVTPEILIERACWICGITATPTVCSASAASAEFSVAAAPVSAVCSPSFPAALPTKENSPVAIQAAEPRKTSMAR